jgi:hypothetical protein
MNEIRHPALRVSIYFVVLVLFFFHRIAGFIRIWAMISLLREKGIGEQKLAIDRANLTLVLESRRQSLYLIEGSIQRRCSLA